jgi:hypothetical protein
MSKPRAFRSPRPDATTPHFRSLNLNRRCFGNHKLNGTTTGLSSILRTIRDPRGRPQQRSFETSGPSLLTTVPVCPVCSLKSIDVSCFI